MQMLGATAIAAALAMTTITSCSSEIDNSIEEQPVEVTPGQEGVKITISAGIDDGDATTRSEVEYNTTTKTRTLKFTTGDRLYVFGAIRDDDPVETWIYTYLAGYLNVSTIGEYGNFTLLSEKRTGHRAPPISTQERTQAHIVCCLPCGAEGQLLLP